MQLYRVNYALATESYESNVNFTSSTDRNNLEIVVPAMYPNQAQMIVETMFGGPSKCWAKSAVPVN